MFLGQRLQLRNSTAAQRLAAEFLAQQNGERNLLIAFRHPSPRDPLVLADLFWSCVPRIAGPWSSLAPQGVASVSLRPWNPPVGRTGDRLVTATQRRHRYHRGRLDRPA